MESIKNLTSQLDGEMNRVFTEYTELHKQLNPHRGKPIGDTDLPEVNRLLKEIQDKFGEVYPVLHFIGARSQFASNAVNGYNDFVDLLKKGAARPHEQNRP